MDEIGFIFLAGAGLPDSVWDKVRRNLNIPSIAVSFSDFDHTPSKRKNKSLEDYVALAYPQIEKRNFRKVVLVTHSIGSAVGLKIAERLGADLAAFVSIAGAIPKFAEGSYASALPLSQRIFLKFILRVFGTRIPDKVVRKRLCRRLSPTQSQFIMRSVQPESVKLYLQPLHSRVPSSKRVYIRTLKDAALNPAYQRKMAEQLHAEARELDTGHLAMIEDPRACATLLTQIVNECKPETFYQQPNLKPWEVRTGGDLL